MDSALLTARLIVPDNLRARFDEMAQRRYWLGISMLVASHIRIRLLEALWRVLTADERPDVFASWFDGYEVPSHCHEFVLKALGEFKCGGRRLFDSQIARERYEQFPDIVKVYSGGVETDEPEGRLGISWTLDRDQAVRFAMHHSSSIGSFRPVLHTARVNRGAIAGFLVERGRDEVLLVPDDVFLDNIEPLDRTEELPVLLGRDFEITRDLNEDDPAPSISVTTKA